MTNIVTIIGSINVDRTLHVEDFPKPGETIEMTDYTRAGGGKGANQAIAAVRAGCITNFIGSVGTDHEAKFMLQEMRQNNINTSGITKVDYELTGQAYILLHEAGENAIIVNAGANAQLSPRLVEVNRGLIEKANFVIGQSETPEKSTIVAFKIAKENNTVTLLNPAPATKLSDEILGLTNIIVLNEAEAEKITGIKAVDNKAAKDIGVYFHDKGVDIAIITLGHRGSYVSTPTRDYVVPPVEVEEVDPTGAGDAYIGGLVSILKPDLTNLDEALNFASHASALAVKKLGAFPSIPTKDEIIASL